MRFSQSRLKIFWADQHIAKLENWLAGLPDSYVSSIEIDPALRHKSIKHDVTIKELGTTAALLVGDIAHNLKCALDYAWIEVITRVAPAALSKFAKFPVYANPQKLEDALRGREIHVASPGLFRLMIDEIQPYDGGNFAIWPIYVLNRRDKHRLLIPIINYANISGIEVQDQSGEIVRGDTMLTGDGPPYYVDFSYDLEIKDKGKLSLSISFDDTLIAYAPRVDDTLAIYSRFILKVVELLETFLQGSESG